MNNVPPDFFKLFWICTGAAFAGVGAVLAVALGLQKLFFDKFVTRAELSLALTTSEGRLKDQLNEIHTTVTKRVTESEEKLKEQITETRHLLRNDLSAINLQWTNRFDSLAQSHAAIGAKVERILGRLEGEHEKKKNEHE